MSPDQKNLSAANPPDKFNSIEKAFQLLLTFLPDNDSLSTAELSKITGFHKATTSRILRTMAELGFVRQNASTKHYSLGESIVKLSSAIHRSLNSGIISLATPYLTELRKQTGQTTAMELLTGHVTVMGCLIEGDISIRVAGQVGETLQWNVTAGMRAIMAYIDDQLRREILAQPMAPLTENSIITPEAYQDELNKIRKTGYSFDDGEVVVGVNAIAAPVFNYESAPIAAVSLVGLAPEINKRKAEFASLVKKTTKAISKALMYPG